MFKKLKNEKKKSTKIIFYSKLYISEMGWDETNSYPKPPQTPS